MKPGFFFRRSQALLFLLALLLGPGASRAQYKVQVVTRTVEQALACPAGTLVRIRGEKATMRVQGWNQPTVRLVLNLSARHPERAVAESELPSARYQFDRHGNTIDLVNYFVVGAGVAVLRSDLRAEFTLWVPAGVRLEVRNLYGQTTLSGLTGTQELEQDFGQLNLNNISGSLRANVRYADVVGTATDGALVLAAEKSSVRLTGAAGRCTVSDSYGSVVVAPAPGIISAVINAERSDVTLQVPQPELFNFALSSPHGQLALPPRLVGGSPRSPGRTDWQLTHGPGLPLLRVRTSYSSISLQTTALTILR